MGMKRNAPPRIARVPQTTFSLRIPLSMWNAIVEAAKEEGIAVSDWGRRAFRKSLKVKGDRE